MDALARIGRGFKVGSKRSAEECANVGEDEIEKMKSKELKEILGSLHLPKSGKVEELRARLLQARRASASEGDSKTHPEPKGAARSRADGSSASGHVMDPLEIPPNYYHKDLFRACFPLVNIVDVPKDQCFPVTDKFEGCILDPDQTREARLKWMSRFVTTNSTYAEPVKEGQAFPIHFSFVEPLKKFTRLSRDEVVKQTRFCGKRTRCVYEETARDDETGKRLKDENNAGMSIESVPDLKPQLGGHNSNNAGMTVTLEGAASLTGELRDLNSATGFADGVINVSDERPRERAKAAGKEWRTMNAERAVAVLERKFREDALKFNAKFQGGFYAVKYALQNLRHHHSTPLYVLVMTNTSWSYGILVPDGYVGVGSDGQIVADTRATYEEQQRVTGGTRSFDSLQAALEQGTSFYRSCYKDRPEANYPRGTMLVATFYLCSEWFEIPRLVKSGGETEGAVRLFDGLMRLILGDAVIGFTAKDFAQRLQMRKTMKMERLTLLMPDV